jgi:NAD(P)-dependent dehydrogenase (short-subunit alcohol dehydrogenase family)
MARFDGRTALVTGAASGIGRAATLRLASEGARVLAVDWAEDVEAVAGGGVTAMRGDAGDEAFVTSAVARAVSEFGALDMLFANAGVGGGLTRLWETTVEEWERVLRVNLVGVFLAVREAAKVMMPAGRGAMVLTASVAGMRSGAGGVPYSASKAGVINLAQTSANQLAGTGIRVNALLPGLTETGMTQPLFDGARARGTDAKLGQLNPLRRAAAADEAAAAACWLLSDDASYVNGQALPVDGGLSSSHPVVPGKFV